MRHLKLISLAALAACATTALLALAAAGASAAEPEWGRCVAVKSKGHFEDSSCTKEDFTENKKHVKKYKGKFEWLPGAATDCYATSHGRYKNSECTEEDVVKGKPKGSYEKTGGPKFTSEMASLSRIYLRWSQDECLGATAPVPRAACGTKGFEPFGNFGIQCASEHATGEAAGTDEVITLSIHFGGCAWGFDSSPASTPGLPEGEIEFNALKGRLGYTDKSTHEVGLQLEPASPGAPIAEIVIDSGIGRIELRMGAGSVAEGSFYEASGTPGEPNGHDGFITTISPANEMTSTLAQNAVLKEETLQCREAYCARPEYFEQENVPNALEGGRLEEMELLEFTPTGESDRKPGEKSEWESAGLALESVDTMEGGPVEIKG